MFTLYTKDYLLAIKEFIVLSIFLGIMLGSYIPVKSNENLQNSLELGITCQSSPFELNSKVILFNQSSAISL